jgi:hypothetical protein
MLPKAAAAYRAMIAKGVDKHRQASAIARAALRQLIGGQIKLNPAVSFDGTPYLEASFGIYRIALLNCEFAEGKIGSGGSLWNFRRFYKHRDSKGYPGHLLG